MKKVLRIFLAVIIVVTVFALPVYAARGGHGGHSGHFGHGGGHVGIGLFVGPDWWGPGWWGPYPYYPYYQSPPVIVQPPPEIYVQPAPQAEEPNYWYFCPEPQGYYPYIKTCPKGWMKVVPPGNPSE
jgi:hypothetical protein